MPKIIKIKRGRSKKLADQPGEEHQGNPKKVPKVSSKTDRSYKRTPPPPKKMAAEGRKYWKEHADGYVAMNRLNRDTRPLFLHLCAFYATWVEWHHKDLERMVKGLSIIEEPKPSRECSKYALDFAKLFKNFIDVSAQYEKKDKGFKTFLD